MELIAPFGVTPNSVIESPEGWEGHASRIRLLSDSTASELRRTVYFFSSFAAPNSTSLKTNLSYLADQT